MRPGEHETSVKQRLLDLLETFEGDWFSIENLVNEYSGRFGEVKMDTLRQAIFRELRRDDCVMFVRYIELREDLGGPPHRHLEVAWRIKEAV